MRLFKPRLGVATILALLAMPTGHALAVPESTFPETTPGLSFEAKRRPDGTMVLHARGRIAKGDAARLEEAARAAGAAEVWLDSPGGAAAEGMRVGRAIRALGLNTRVYEGSICASACADAFLGGVQRYVAVFGILGVHRPTLTGQPGWRERLEAMTRDRGLDEAIRMLEATSLLLAYEFAAFLQEMGVAPEFGLAAYTTPNADLRRPTQQEMLEWRVVTGAWDPIGDSMRATRERARQFDEEVRRRAVKELPQAEQMQREAEAMLQSLDPTTRRYGEVLARLAASIRRDAELAVQPSPAATE